MNNQENCVFLAFRIADAREEMAEGAKYSFEIYVCRVFPMQFHSRVVLLFRRMSAIVWPPREFTVLFPERRFQR